MPAALDGQVHSALADELTAQGHPVSSWTVAQLLHYMEFSLQANAKTAEGAHNIPIVTASSIGSTTR